MGYSFGEKFEKALAEKRAEDDKYGLRTLARKLADNDPHQTEIIRRRLNKYRPPKGGGAAEVSPTAPTRREIEDAMGLERDSLAPDREAVAARMAADAEFLQELAPLRRLFEISNALERGELQIVQQQVTA